MQLLLGVDGGGSKTDIAVADANGVILGRGQGGVANYQLIGIEAAGRSMLATIQETCLEAGVAVSAISAGCFGLAGVARSEDHQLWTTWAATHLAHARVQFVNDAELVLAAGTDSGWGIAVISGTGAITIGKKADGTATRTDGWGYLLGDDGSGYAIGRAALRAVARAHDGRGAQSRLSDLILHALSLNKVEDLVRRVYVEQLTPAETASLAPLVDRAAKQDDAVALEILQQAGRELAHSAATVFSKLALPAGATAPCALAGGIVINSDVVFEEFCREVKARKIGLEPIVRVKEPVMGAIRLAQTGQKSAPATTSTKSTAARTTFQRSSRL